MSRDVGLLESAVEEDRGTRSEGAAERKAMNREARVSSG